MPKKLATGGSSSLAVSAMIVGWRWKNRLCKTGSNCSTLCNDASAADCNGLKKKPE